MLDYRRKLVVFLAVVILLSYKSNPNYTYLLSEIRSGVLVPVLVYICAILCLATRLHSKKSIHRPPELVLTKEDRIQSGNAVKHFELAAAYF
jgi:hypothetical protein